MFSDRGAEGEPEVQKLSSLKIFGKAKFDPV